MINVLHLLCDYSAGGAEKFVFSLCSAYPSHINPKICTIYEGGELEADFKSLGIMRHHCRRKRKRLDVSATLKLSRWISESDILHTHLFAGHFWGRISAQIANLTNRRVPIVSTFHNTNPDTKIRGWLLEQTMGWSNANIGISQAVTSTLIKPARTIYSGISLTHFMNIQHKPSPGFFLSIGRLVPQKAFDVLAEAMAILHASDTAISAHVLGEGPKRDELSSSALILHGFQQDVRPYLGKAEVFVCPSRWEGLGIVLIEAMAVGVPIVASDIPICREVCGEAAIYVPVDNPKALANAMKELHLNPEKRRNLSLIGRKQAQAFSASQAAKEYSLLYESLINKT